MVRSLLQTSFNGGELSARMEGRPDLAAYGIAARELTNLILTVQGPVVKRSGTAFVAWAKSSTAAVALIPFEYNITQGYVIEAGNEYFRFFTNDAQIMAGDDPYEIETPFETADLPNLDWEQSADVLYLVDGRHPPQRLARTGAETFSIGDLQLKNGPLKDQNTDEALTVIASGTSGSVTLTASAALFLPGHVGGLIELEAKDFRSIPAWEPNVKVALNDKRRSEGKVYRAAALPASGSERTGTERPTHDEGQERDGTSTLQDYNSKDSGGVLWEYLYSRAGLLRITAYTSATVVTATVLKRLPDEVVTTATDLWALGAFSNAEGWPSAVRIRDERLWLAKGTQLFGSVVGDYEDFAARDGSGLPQADLGIRRKLPTPDPVQWLANDRSLLVGTTKGEYALTPVNPAAAIAFNNLATPRQSGHGSRKVRPVAAGSSTLFVSRSGRKLRAADYMFDRDKYVSPDATVRAEHVTQGGITVLAAQMEPESNIWALRTDGTLICLTWSEEQDVRGFSRVQLAGEGARVCGIAVIPSPDGTHDQLWVAAHRVLDGAERVTIERLLPLWREGQAQETGCFLDCSATYEGTPATVIGGLTWLAGETVSVIVDGAVHPDVTVSEAGSVTLQRAGAVVHVGFFFPARVRSMRLHADTESGSGLTKIKRTVKLGLGLQETLGVRVARDTAGAPWETVPFRKSSQAMSAAVPLFTGEVLVGFPGRYDREARVVVESWQALPFTLNSLAPRLEVSDGE